MKKYVVGIIINEDKVVLIRKNRPLWQAGRLNGLGGQVEKLEDYYTAMVRECHEECGLVITNWEYIGVLTDNSEYTVKYYVAFVEHLDLAATMTDEHIEIHDLYNLNYNQLVPPTDVFIRLASHNMFMPIELIVE